MLAVANGHIETVQSLLSHDADLSIVDLYEKSVIYSAAEENAVEVLKVFYWTWNSSRLTILHLL